MSSHETEATLIEAVAIVGMAGRFPGARSVAEFWRNQVNGIEAISQFRVEDLQVPDAARLAQSPDYVRARSVLEDVEMFDADFFGIYPREAELIDPQQRLFLEVCWEAFEDAGYNPFAYPGAVGVFAGSSASTYFLSRLCSVPGFIQKYTGAYQVGNYGEMMGNNPDFLSTRVAYKFNLRGPAFTMQAGCSTSLLAVCQACQSLLTYQSDMALAGGSSITFPQRRGSHYQEGGMISPDGHCRAFSSDARGTVFGSGVAVVLLKRLEEAVRDGDQVYGIIRGFAVNNDGSAKVGYTAPSVEGQSAVIALAQEAAGVHPESIGYIEAHGTGTPLGDPIELTALAQTFRAKTKKRGFCAIGTAKTNVGHLDIAAGVTGLIHATHVVRNGTLPPTLHFQRPNPKFDLESSPFYVNTAVKEWNNGAGPRRAGVSAFGVGGTNAHLVLEQAATRPSPVSQRQNHLLVLSARSEAALDQATENLEKHLRAHPDANLADVAWTLQLGRKSFACRRALTVRNLPEAIDALAQRDPKRVRTRLRATEKPAVHFLFPGQGSQHPNMGKEIYQREPVFRNTVDHCAEILLPHLGADLRHLLYPSAASAEDAKRQVTETIIAQPAIFTIEYALAQLWMHWGVRPTAMLGHSIGEFVAACIAGVFSLEDALALVAARGRMMQEVSPGGMLSVRLPESELRARINGSLSLAAINAPQLCVVAGPFPALDELERQLAAESIPCRRLVTSHAFHSEMMDPLIEPFTARVKQVPLSTPRIPYVSGVSGSWITAEQATSADYWARHFRQAVQFSPGILELRKSPGVLLEVGPGNVLSTLARQHGATSADLPIVTSLSDGFSGEGDGVSLANAIASLWLAGVQPDWAKLYGGEQRQRISLPTYPFERKRFWLETPSAEDTVGLAATTPAPNPDTTIEFSANAEERTSANVSPSIAITNAVALNRTAKIRMKLESVFEDLSGVDVSSQDASTTFLEMGFDSLFLTQVTQALQSDFGLKITFRQLLDELSTLDALSVYLDRELPPEVLVDPAPSVVLSVNGSAAPAAPVAASTYNGSASSGESATPANRSLGTGGESGIERLMREQLQAMNLLFSKQLETIRSGSPTNSAAIVPAISSGSATAETASKTEASAKPATAPVAKLAGEVVSEKEEFKPFGPYKPPQRGLTGDLTERQKAGLLSLIERYTQKTARSKELTQEHRQYLADPRVVSGFRSQWKEIVYPIVTNRSQGSKLWDIDGNAYIDILNGFGPIMLGHRPEFVEKAVEEQLHQGFEIGPQTPLACEIAKMFCEMTGNERMTFCNTGSEAVMAAMRVSRTVTGRARVVVFTGDYHGMFDEALVKGFNKGGVPHTSPVAPGIPRENVGNMTVLEYGKPESLEWIRQHAQELAAVLVEPVQSRHPHLQPVEFLKEVREITRASGTALIFDEVVTGFRVHPGGCQALFGIRADLATYGKVIAGGMPIGILAGKAQFMDCLDGGAWQYSDDSYPSVGVTFFAGTFVRHPLALAAVKAVLLHFKTEGPSLQENLGRKTERLAHALNNLFEINNVPTRIESFGSIFYFSFPPEERYASLFYYYLRMKGIHVLEGFPCFLTTAHSDADIEQVISAFQESVFEMQRAGFFPEPAGKTDPDGTEVMGDSRRDTVGAPLTEPQLEVWLSDQLGKEASCSYNESFTLHMRGAVNEAALKQALQQLVQRHEALRATFSAEGNLQHFLAEARLEIPTFDLSSSDEMERARQVANMIAEDAHREFSLCTGPLVRARIVKMEANYSLLIFTSHHIVCDGWSTNVLLDELAKLYNGLNRGIPCALPAAMSFAAYARSQREFLESAEGKKIEKYWVEQFAQPVQPLDLPTDRPRPSVKEFKGATHRWKINADSYNRIKSFGARQKCTLFVTLLTGFQVLLSRLSGQNDIVVGIPTAGQSAIEDASLVGHCVNFIPLRGHVSQNDTLTELLSQMKQTVLAGYEHQNYTYGRLVRKLALQRDPSRLPITEVQFNLERVGDNLEFDGFHGEVDPNPKSFVNFDIFFNVVESKDGLTIDCDYNTGLFDEQTIVRWLHCYESLLHNMMEDAHRPIARVSLLTETDRREILDEGNATGAEYDRKACVHTLIEAQAKAMPDAIAVAFEGEQLSYAELNIRANRLANYLLQSGVKPGALVGVLLDRSIDMLVALLGVMKSGGVYVPMDPTYPPERIAFVIEDAKMPALLTQRSLALNFAPGATRVIHVDDCAEIASAGDHAPAVSVSSSDPAYVIYTSGSTGKPKGVEIAHRNVVNLLCSMRRQPGLESGDTLLAVTTLSFDIAGLELYLPLVTGAKLVIASREDAADGARLLHRLIACGANVIQATPVTFRFLIEAGWNGDPKLKVLCGGEALPRDLANQILERATSLWNMYGPTETTIWSSTLQLHPGADLVAIGPPIANTQFHVLDSLGELLPVGVAGELHIGGDGLARGYFRRAELTSEKFIANPFNPGDRLYKTGDLVRRLPNGTFEFLGRLDQQVKLRGFRIELGEIEAALGRYPGVKEVAVSLREDLPGDKRLVAYLVSEQQGMTVTAVREFLTGRLPNYMLPSAVVRMDALPLTPNGKVDRRALPIPDVAGPAAREFVAPRSALEKTLAGIWSEVLHLERVGITDNLFELGADSLHIFQIAARARKAGVDIAPAQFLKHRTIAALLEQLQNGAGNANPTPAISPVSRERYRVKQLSM